VTWFWNRLLLPCPRPGRRPHRTMSTAGRCLVIRGSEEYSFEQVGGAVPGPRNNISRVDVPRPLQYAVPT